MSDKMIKSIFYIVLIYAVFSVSYTFHNTVIQHDFQIVEVEEE